MKKKGDISLREHMQKASLARWAKMTPKELSEYGKKMSKARWKKHNERKKGVAPAS